MRDLLFSPSHIAQLNKKSIWLTIALSYYVDFISIILQIYFTSIEIYYVSLWFVHSEANSKKND